MSIKYISHTSDVREAVDQAIARAFEICGGTYRMAEYDEDH